MLFPHNYSLKLCRPEIEMSSDDKSWPTPCQFLSLSFDGCQRTVKLYPNKQIIQETERPFGFGYKKLPYSTLPGLCNVVQEQHYLSPNDDGLFEYGMVCIKANCFI